MSVSLTIQSILSKVKELDKEEQLTLLEKLVAVIRKNEATTTPTKLSNISGIGSEIWREINIDDHIDQERQW